MALAPDDARYAGSSVTGGGGEGGVAAEAAKKWVGIFWREGQIASFGTRPGKPAQGRGGAAGAEFGSAVSQQSVQACPDPGA